MNSREASVKMGAELVAAKQRIAELEEEVERQRKLLDQFNIGSDGWIPWAGEDCPVDPDEWVEVKLRGMPGDPATTSANRAGVFAWWCEGGVADIIAYRVVAP